VARLRASVEIVASAGAGPGPAGDVGGMLLDPPTGAPSLWPATASVGVDCGSSACGWEKAGALVVTSMDPDVGLGSCQDGAAGV
jgi:hypothetical protein